MMSHTVNAYRIDEGVTVTNIMALDAASPTYCVLSPFRKCREVPNSSPVLMLLVFQAFGFLLWRLLYGFARLFSWSPLDFSQLLSEIEIICQSHTRVVENVVSIHAALGRY